MATMELASIPRELPQFGRHLSSLARPASEVFGTRVKEPRFARIPSDSGATKGIQLAALEILHESGWRVSETAVSAAASTARRALNSANSIALPLPPLDPLLILKKLKVRSPEIEALLTTLWSSGTLDIPYDRSLRDDVMAALEHMDPGDSPKWRMGGCKPGNPPTSLCELIELGNGLAVCHNTGCRDSKGFGEPRDISQYPPKEGSRPRLPSGFYKGVQCLPVIVGKSCFCDCWCKPDEEHQPEKQPEPEPDPPITPIPTLPVKSWWERLIESIEDTIDRWRPALVTVTVVALVIAIAWSAGGLSWLWPILAF